MLNGHANNKRTVYGKLQYRSVILLKYNRNEILIKHETLSHLSFICSPISVVSFGMTRGEILFFTLITIDRIVSSIVRPSESHYDTIIGVIVIDVVIRRRFH